MVFSDLFFIYAFLPAFLLCYLLGTFVDKRLLSKTAGNQTAKSLGEGSSWTNATRNVVLVVFSLLFYAWGEPVYVFLMMGSVVINYFLGRVIDRSDTHRKTALIAGVACNILILGTFKYLGFFAAQLLALGMPVSVPKIALPIGISFYIFQSISYLVDVYRRESKAQRRFVDLLLYISMFPQLIAGPIVRYSTVAKEINNRRVTTSDVADGIYRFMIGLAKKVIIANQLSEVSGQFLGDGLDSLTTTGAWIGVVAFTFQIYFDFSGYSDMAIGIGRCLGFHFNENFDHPYCSRSITEFWRRWHMSLGSFFRDYVYIPLGGNRRHQALNIMVVWFLTGMWHGASWNFIIWGLYFGLIVSIEKFTLLRFINKVPRPLLHLYTMVLVIISWGMFYFDDFGQMQTFFKAFFGLGSTTFHNFLTENALFSHFWLWCLALLLATPLRRTVHSLVQRRITSEHTMDLVNSTTRLVLSLAILIVCTALLVGATNNTFLYTRF